jgi:catechol 1,2-dioxygenase
VLCCAGCSELLQKFRGVLISFLQALAEGYKPITTQIFDRRSKYLDDDSVFAVKESLIVDFVPIEDKDHQASTEVKYDVLLVPVESST